MSDASNYPASSLTGTIANGKLANSTVSFGGVTLSLGGSDPTPAFDLSDASNYPASALTGTISNAQLAGSIDLSTKVTGTLSPARLTTSTPAASRVLIATSSTAASWATYASVCFLPGTKITLSDRTKINIEDIKPGDMVLSYKLNDMEPYDQTIDVLSWFSEDDSGEFTESKVAKLWKDTSFDYIILNDTLKVTYEHNIFTKMDDEYTWVSAKNIRVGDLVFNEDGEYEEITKVEHIPKYVTVYNMQVKSDSMNYFTDSYLVHNASNCDECSAKNSNKL